MQLRRESYPAMDKNFLNLLGVGVPLFLIILMTLLMFRSGKARQDEYAHAFKKEMSMHEDNNRILKEILKTLKRIEKNSRPGGNSPTG